LEKEHFWGLAAFSPAPGTNPGSVNDAFTTRITSTGGNASKDYEAMFLEGPAPRFPSGRSPRAVLADWLASPENRYFAANVVNRVWQDLCGTGLVSTIDDLDTLEGRGTQADPDELAAKFAANGFNLRWLIEAIASPSVPAGEYVQRRAWVGPAPSAGLSPDQVFAGLDQALKPQERSRRRSALHRGGADPQGPA